MRKLLQLTRAHTAPLEIVPAVLGALLATQGELELAVVLWGIFGLLYHLTGYAHNSVSDYQQGYDKGDPYKQHHPLNKSGLIFEHISNIIVSVLFGITLIYTATLVYPSAEGTALMVIMILAGLGYNLYGKETKFKFVLISIAHSSVFALPYVSLGGEILNPVFLLAWVYVFLWVVFQIAISGEIKDIDTDEENTLMSLGIEISYDEIHDEVNLEIPRRIPLIGVVIRSGMMMCAVGVGVITRGVGSVLAVIIIWLSMFSSSDMLYSGTYNRDHRLKLMSLIEASSLTGFCLIMAFYTGHSIAVGLILGSTIWLVVLNKIEWGTYLTPRV